MSEIAQRVKKIVSQELGVEEEKLSGSTNFTEDLGADSLDSVELIMTLEEEFGVEIPAGDAEKIQTIQNVVDYIKEHKEAA